MSAPNAPLGPLERLRAARGEEGWREADSRDGIPVVDTDVEHLPGLLAALRDETSPVVVGTVATQTPPMGRCTAARWQYRVRWYGRCVHRHNRIRY